MPRITVEQAGHVNLCAFLDVIAAAEGTSTSPATQDDGYDVIVSSVDAQGHLKLNTMTGYSDHPFANGRKSLVVNSRGLTSNASGRYQQMLKDWPHYKERLHLPDFGPISQDLLALKHIEESRATSQLIAGNFVGACDAVSNIWASIPGSKNTYGQPQRTMGMLRATFLLNGGTINE